MKECKRHFRRSRTGKKRRRYSSSSTFSSQPQSPWINDLTDSNQGTPVQVRENKYNGGGIVLNCSSDST